MSFDLKNDNVVEKKEEFKFKKPKKKEIFYLNDEITPVEFVIESLVVVFEKSIRDAHEIVFNTHFGRTDGFSVMIAGEPVILEKEQELNDFINKNKQTLQFEVRDIDDED